MALDSSTDHDVTIDTPTGPVAVADLPEYEIPVSQHETVTIGIDPEDIATGERSLFSYSEGKAGFKATIEKVALFQRTPGDADYDEDTARFKVNFTTPIGAKALYAGDDPEEALAAAARKVRGVFGQEDRR